MYQYQLRACNPEGCSPGVVTDLRTTAQIRGAYTRTSGESATISWTLTPSEGATRVEIRRRTLVGEAYGPMEDLGQVPASPASFTDSGLSPGAQYRYHIRGCQGSVCTEWENGRSI